MKRLLSGARPAYLGCALYQLLLTLVVLIQSNGSALRRVYTTVEEHTYYHTEPTAILPALLVGGALMLALEIAGFLLDFLLDQQGQFVKLLTPVFLLLGTGIVFQAVIHPQGAMRHILTIVAGLVFAAICFILSSLTLSKREFRGMLIFVIGVSMLAVLIALTIRRNRTGGLWGELAKLLSIYLCAVAFPHVQDSNCRKLFFGGLGALLVSVVIMKDFGTAAVLGCVLLCALLYVSPVLTIICAIGMSSLAALGVLVLRLFNPTSYILTRISACGKVLLDSEANENFRRMLLSVVRAGVFGTGASPANTFYAAYGFGSQHDFCFLALTATFGMGMAILVVLCFAALALECCKYTAARSNRRIISINMPGFFIVLQAAISILGQLNLIPLTGIPIPFVAYGGSAMLCCLGVVGIALAARLSTPERSSIEYQADKILNHLPFRHVEPENLYARLDELKEAVERKKASMK
jgi:cell division protein FtsW (lipid II flippase)